MTTNNFSMEYACKVRRNFKYDVTESESEKKFIYRHNAAMAAIKEIVKRNDLNMSLDEIESILNEQLAPYYNVEKERQEVCYQTARQVARYAKYLLSEIQSKGMYQLGHTKTISMNGVNVRGAVAFIFHYEYNGKKFLETVVLHTGAARSADITYGGTKNCSGTTKFQYLMFYWQLMYNRSIINEFGAPGVSYQSIVSHIFLKRNDDSEGKTPNFDPEFTGKGAYNVINIGEEVVSRGPETQDMIEHNRVFDPLLTRFMNGLDKEGCDKENCKKCGIYGVCRINSAPKPITRNVLVEAKTKSMTPNPSQTAVINADAPLNLCYGGPGSGKSASLVMRYVHMVTDLHVPYEDILVIVFTDNNAKDMKKRIMSTLKKYGLNPEPDEILVMTCHSFGNKIIKKEYKRFGFSKAPSVIDDEENAIKIAKLLNKLPKIDGISYSNMVSKFGTGTIKLITKIFALIKEHRLTYSEESVLELQHLLGDGVDYVKNASAWGCFFKMYEIYQRLLIKENLIVHSDEELLVEDLLDKEPLYLNRFGSEQGFKYINIDEVQDFNAWQMKLTNYLCSTKSFKSLMMVGDDDQAIYGFRDASPEYMLNIEQYLGNKPVQKLMLMENYRAAKNFCDIANTFIQKNQNRAEKSMIPMREEGTPAVAKAFFSSDEEYDFIANDINRLIKEGVMPNQIMFQARTERILQKLSERLSKLGIPSVLLNPEKYINNLQSLAAISFCKAVASTEDGGNKDIIIVANALTKEHNLLELDAASQGTYFTQVNNYVNEVRNISDKNQKKDRIIEILRSFDTTDDEIYSNFVTILERKSLEGLLEHAILATEYGNDAGMRRINDYNCVSLCTAHSAKGLEADYCYVCLDSYMGKNDSLETEEENRRLAYVALTRAKEYLCVTGEYKAYGYGANLTLNKFLMEAIECIDGTAPDKGTVIAGMQDYNRIRKAS